MSKRRIATAGEYKPKRSRYMQDEHAKDEHQLAAIAVIMILLIVGTIIYINESDIADRFIENAATIYKLII